MEFRQSLTRSARLALHSKIADNRNAAAANARLVPHRLSRLRTRLEAGR